MDFTILVDENTDDGDRSQLAIFVRTIGSNHRPIEHFLGITCIAISKTAAAIMDIISNSLISKAIQPSYIRFCGLDRTNSMSSECCGLEHLIKHSSPHAEYINCRNRQLPLCFVHLLKEFPSLASLDTILLFVWKLFKACVCYFFANFYFSPNDSPPKTMKMFFISSKKLFLFSRYSSFCIPVFLSIFPVSHFFRG